MASRSKSGATKNLSSKIPITTAVIILGLSIATWVFFDAESQRLTTPETTVVVGIWILIVFFMKGAWGRLHKQRKKRG
jgi:hypothetical protein